LCQDFCSTFDCNLDPSEDLNQIANDITIDDIKLPSMADIDGSSQEIRKDTTMFSANIVKQSTLSYEENKFLGMTESSHLFKDRWIRKMSIP